MPMKQVEESSEAVYGTVIFSNSEFYQKETISKL